MTPLLFGRALTLLIFLVGITWGIVWMFSNRQLWGFRFPRFLLGAHGSLFYGAYLLYFFHPGLHFRLQAFSDWGSIFTMHVAWYLLFSQIEDETGFFSNTLPRWFFRRVGGQ